VSNLSYLFVAFLITWIVIGAYLWMLNRQVQNLKDEVDTLTEESVFEPEHRPRLKPSGYETKTLRD
jgi:CcmD family protein